MPLLAIFSRKKSRNAADNTSTTDHDSPSISPSAEYVTPDKSLPSHPNGKNIYHNTVYPSLATSSGGNSKLRIPFTRKSSTAGSISSIATDRPAIPARPSFNSNTASDVGHAPETRNRTPRSQLRPPPSKSAIFAAYGDPNSALSTRSLPTHPKKPTEPPPIPPLPSTPPAKKSFFGWTKGKSKTTPDLSKISPPPSVPSLAPAQEQDSFNLRSFRHLGPSSPEDALPPSRPRSRHDSLASDSSQRISVAAFREVQARRSVAGSPAPSFRSPSPGPMSSSSHLPKTANDSPRASRSRSPPTLRNAPQQNSNPQIRQPPFPAHTRVVAPRRSTAPTLSFASSSARTVSLALETSSEESSEEEDSEEDVGTEGKVVRQRTITKGSADAQTSAGGINPAKAKSESGHGSTNWRPGVRPQSSIELLSGPASAGIEASNKVDDIPPRSQSSLGTYGASRRANFSTGDLTHSAPANTKETPVVVVSVVGESAAPGAQTCNLNRSSSSSSSSTDSDDAPLATLVGPKRPGSSVSNASGSRAVVGPTSSSNSHSKPRKPLIDISTLTAPARPSASPPSGAGFTGGPTLLATVSKPEAQSPKLVTPPPAKFVSPPTSDASSVSEGEDVPEKKTSMFQRKAVSPTVKHSTLASPVSPKVPQPQRETFPSTSRKSTASPPPSSPPLSSKRTSPPPRKEGLSSINFSERLSKVVQQNVGKGPTGANGGKDLADQKSPSASKPTRVVHHRRVSSDQTIAWRETGETSPSGSGRAAADNTKGAESHRGPEGEKKDKAEHIVPTPIRQRDPPSAFSVTSRPRQHPEPSPPQPRPRSTTLLSSSTPSGNANGNANGGGANERPSNPRQRSTTMVPHSTPASSGLQMMPAKPFAERWESPASSTGGSSSGRMPLTPRDGSDLGGDWGSSRDSAWGSGVSGLGNPGGRGHTKKPSVVSFEDEGEVRGRERRMDEKESAGQGENRRNERRRSEAKAAIELGNVINGPGPNLDDEDEEDGDVPVNQAMGNRMSMISPRMMPMGFSSPPTTPTGWTNAWPQQQQQQQHLLSPAQFMIPAPADPSFFAAHQQAMLIAKQAYQMAVAQQALAAAGEEWERGSNASGFGGAMSMYGGPGPAALPVPGLGMGAMGMGGGWPTGPVMLQPGYGGGGARSDYGGGGARSEYGWGSSRSVYGESFGPSDERGRGRRGMAVAVPPLPERGSGGGGGGGSGHAGVREGKGRTRTTSVPNPPVSPQRASFGKKMIPPSSWKSGGA